MHSHDTPAGRRYHHNSDFSGEVRLLMKPNEIEAFSFGGEEYVLVTVPMGDLRAIVAADLQGQAEQQSAEG